MLIILHAGILKEIGQARQTVFVFGFEGPRSLKASCATL
jgi:hypothetical protein